MKCNHSVGNLFCTYCSGQISFPVLSITKCFEVLMKSVWISGSSSLKIIYPILADLFPLNWVHELQLRDISFFLSPMCGKCEFRIRKQENKWAVKFEVWWLLHLSASQSALWQNVVIEWDDLGICCIYDIL